MTAFVLSMFQKVDVFDVKELKKLLSTCLSSLYGEETEDVIRKSEYIGPYVALDSILSVINGEKYIQDGRNYLGFGDNRKQILRNLMEQFVDLQNTLLDMIELLLETKYCRVDFYLVQIASLLKELWNDKIIDVECKILPKLCKDEGNINLLATCFYFLYENKNTRTDLNSLLYKWLKWDGRWLWKIPCLVYVQLERDDRETYLVEELEKVIAYRLLSYRKKDYQFLAELLMLSKDFRGIVCRAWQNVYFKTKGQDRKLELVQAYLYLVESCYYKVNEKNMSLPLIVCDSKEQLIWLKEILENIMDNYYLRQRLFALLKAYLKELSQYKFSKSLVNRMAGFCYFLIVENKDFKDDVDEIISQCPNKIAKQLFERMYT